MADAEQVRLLTSSVDEWNQWRVQQPEIRPNISEAILRGADLIEAILSDANLRFADLIEATLSRASLISTDFREADLSKAQISNSDLRYADLYSLTS